MKDIAFHITDIAENGIRAGARNLGISIEVSGDEFALTIIDDGCGMDPDTVRRVTDPFYTTRTTRKVGLGLPFLIQNAEQCGGNVNVESQPGLGTAVRAVFRTDNLDCPPAGDIPTTVMLIMTGNPDIDTTYTVTARRGRFSLSTAEIREILDGIPPGHPRVATMIRDIISENTNEIFKTES